MTIAELTAYAQSLHYRVNVIPMSQPGVIIYPSLGYIAFTTGTPWEEVKTALDKHGDCYK